MEDISKRTEYLKLKLLTKKDVEWLVICINKKRSLREMLISYNIRNLWRRSVKIILSRLMLHHLHIHRRIAEEPICKPGIFHWRSNHPKETEYMFYPSRQTRKYTLCNTYRASEKYYEYWIIWKETQTGFIDIESTGLDFDRHEIIEIGVSLWTRLVRYKPSFQVTERVSLKVRPERIGDAIL